MTGLNATRDKKYQIHLHSNEASIAVLFINKDEDSDRPKVVSIPLSEDAQEAFDSVLEDSESVENTEDAPARRSGRGKVKASELSPPPPAKKVKKESDEEQMRRDKEVETILKGSQYLDTNFEGLEDIFSNEST